MLLCVLSAAKNLACPSKSFFGRLAAAAHASVTAFARMSIARRCSCCVRCVAATAGCGQQLADALELFVALEVDREFAFAFGGLAEVHFRAE